MPLPGPSRLEGGDSSPPPDALAPLFLPGSAQVLIFHLESCANRRVAAILEYSNLERLEPPPVAIVSVAQIRRELETELSLRFSERS